jgi:hypothetical protein
MRTIWATLIHNRLVVLRAYPWTYFIGTLATGILTVGPAFLAYHAIGGGGPRPASPPWQRPPTTWASAARLATTVAISGVAIPPSDHDHCRRGACHAEHVSVVKHRCVHQPTRTLNGGEFSLPITSMIIWHIVAIWSALDALMRPKTVRGLGVYDTSTTAEPRAARQVILHVKREEEQRLLRDDSCP